MATVTPTILSAGNPMDPAHELLSIDIRREVNRVPHAELRVLDGSVANRVLPVSDSGFFELGTEIEIMLRYEGGEDATVFKGLVVRHGVVASKEGSILTVGLKDAAVKLTGARRSAVFQSKTDDAIIKQLVTDAGLEVGVLAATQPEHPEMVQYHCTPWDFILSRADALGALVVADDGKISLTKIEIVGAAKHLFDYGITDIFELEIETDAGSQYEGVESVAWNPKEQSPTEASKAASFTATPGNLDGAALGTAIGNGILMLSHPAPVAPAELQAWADAAMARSRMALCRGRLSVPGFAEIKPLDVMEVAGVSERYNGATLVTGLRHRVDLTGWRTDVQFGLPPEAFSRKDDIVDAPAAGLLPGVSGLQIGVVAPFEEDPEKELRVKVILPGVDATKGMVWARLAAPDAGKARGYFFRPEPADEVVVGFLNSDPRFPVILGSLAGSKNAPAASMGAPSADNNQKGIVTKKGTTIGFVDGEKPSVFIETAGKNKLLLDDGAESIILSDKHGNSITMSKDGIVLKSAKDLKIDASSGDVEIKGKKVDVK